MRRWPHPLPAVIVLAALSSCTEQPAPAPEPDPIKPPAPVSTACAPGEALLENDTCLPAGVPADACGEGFKSDAAGGCEAILPQAPCPAGQMAVPGETACRDIAPCGEGTWGDIPVEPDTEYVNAAYLLENGPSDGTKERPWLKIQEGVDAAKAGAIVAVAAGSYAEQVLLANRPVRLWGRCPSLVEITAVKQAILILNKADGAEVHDLAVRDAELGVAVSGTTDVVLDRLWIHDGTGRGIQAADSAGATGLTVRRSLIETTREFGMILAGANVTIESTTVRGTQPLSDNTFGRGVSVQTNPETGTRANVTIRGSVLEKNHEMGAFVMGSDAVIEATVVRDTLASPDKTLGRGITVRSDPDTKERSTATIRASLIERNLESGVLILGSDATIEATVVRDTSPTGDMSGGRGIDIEDDIETGERANVTVRSSLVERSTEFGIFLMASEALLASTIVRDTAVAGDGTLGAGGINIQVRPATGARANATIRSCVVEQSHEMGVFVSGADATIEATLVRDTLPAADDGYGRGINIQAHPGTKERGVAEIRSSLVENSREMGVLVLGSDATLEETIIRGTKTRASDDTFGDGIAVAAFESHVASCSVTGSQVEQSARAGVANFGAGVALGASMVECNPISLNGEELLGRSFAFEDRGGNACGCAGSAASCKVLSANLTPPVP